ncbi:MAG TPA: DUF829 domain-containing protein [Polyangiaceae bacterium]|nr:DUF829 domain-containing protein [Polyangiaceae bacterium]
MSAPARRPAEVTMQLENSPTATEAPWGAWQTGPAGRPREGFARERELVLLLGWGGSSPKQLEPFAQMHRELGREARVFIFRMFRGLLRLGGERPAIGLEAAWLAAAAAERPVIIHSFSDNGSFTFCELLGALRDSPEGRRVIANLRGAIFDSGPALYAASPEDFSARFANALTPICLRRLGLPARQRHAVATPALRACFRLYQACWASTVRRLVGSYEGVSADYPRRPHLFLYSSDDPVSPRRDVEAFAARQRARGVSVEARWPSQPITARAPARDVRPAARHLASSRSTSGGARWRSAARSSYCSQ